MKSMILMIILTLLFTALTGFALAEDAVQGTPITLTIDDTVLEATLNGNTSANDLISRLPVTVNLYDSGHDYCGGINPPLAFDENDVQNGWRDGDLAFWTVGDDFVIFFADEDSSSSTGNIVNIGHITSDIELVRSLPDAIEVTVALAGGVAQSMEDTMMSTAPEGDVRIRITVGEQELTATLIDNATTRAIVDMLPMTLPMMDLYSREMCYRFPEDLPAEEAEYNSFDVGDISYWTPWHSFVIVYAESGEAIDNLQRIGTVDSGVEFFSTTGDTNVTFELLSE